MLLSLPALAEKDELLEKVRRGMALHDAGRYDEVIAAYREALRIVPDNPLALCELALTLSSSGNHGVCICIGARVGRGAERGREMAWLACGLLNRGVEQESGSEIAITVDEARVDEGPFIPIATFVALASAARFLEKEPRPAGKRPGGDAARNLLNSSTSLPSW